jgi:hypothetical protein
VKNKKFILVTGSHRSGSTWTGDILSASPQVRYIHEPFNIGINPQNSLKYWYQYIHESDKAQEVMDYLHHYYRITPRDRAKYLSRVRNTGDLKSFTNKYVLKRNKYLLVKDPIMFFSAEWFAKTHDASVIITIRHPAAFVASLKVKNWHFDFFNFTEQDALMELFTPEIKEKVQEYAHQKPDIIDTGILMWNIIHAFILQYQERNPDWIFVRHEDLSDNPVEEFRKIFTKLSIPFDDYIENKIIESTQANTQDTLKRNASENKESWRRRLSDLEIERVLFGTKEIAERFGY